MNVKPWIEAARLRTLPLSFASILLGSLLAVREGGFSWPVLLLALLTTLCLQVLSNYANDLGDSVHGADHAGRVGPMRAVHAGTISQKAMRNGVIVMGAASLASGCALLAVALHTRQDFAAFLAVGILSIAAAILYTNGRKPYGYAGLGDVSVFIFFGLVGVGGSYALYGGSDWEIVLPAAASAGLLAVGVLNVNNLRDINSDKAAGKLSIPVRIGFANGKRYHGLLIGSAIALALVSVGIGHLQPWAYLVMLVPTGLLLTHIWEVAKLQTPAEADKYLKQLALMSLFADVCLGLVHAFLATCER